MSTPETHPPKTGPIAKWGAVAAVLGALILIIDFFTKSIGFIELIRGRPDPVVVVTERPVSNSSSCLEFAFSELPESFALDRILLKISDPDWQEDPGNMASDVHTRTVNDLLSLAYLTGTKNELPISVRMQATKDSDAMYVDYCPTSASPGQGSITVTPHFFGPSRLELTSLTVKTSNGAPIGRGIRLAIVRSKNETTTKTDVTARPSP